MIIFTDIIKDVKDKGDKAVYKYNKKFDNLSIRDLKVSKSEIKKAYKQIDKKTIDALKFAIKNITYFAKAQLKQFKDFEYTRKGITLGQKIIPIEKVGCYVPGGNYPLPSSALMSIIPAKIAGVKEIIVCSPKIKPVTIVAADLAGADKIFSVGGVQAIAAMTYGTKSIPKVNKIVGPGNKYVTLAKKEVFGEVGIDFIAGPSEVMIITDETGDPRYIAADLLAQAEHDINAVPILITTSKKISQNVKKEIQRQLKSLKTKEIAKKALKNFRLKIVKSLNEAIKLANEKAPEHLEIQIKNPKEIINKLTNYGSLFIGNYSAEVFGDYCSGTNHILPTNGAAKYTSGLSVKDFIKFQTYQKITKKGINKIIPITSKLAEMEGLYAHKNASDIRKK